MSEFIKASEAINSLYCDASVPQEDTRADLQELRDLIDDLMATLEA